MKNIIYLLSYCILTTNLFGEEYLSKTKQDIISYSLKKATQDNNKLTKDWINPIYYKYIYNKDKLYTTTKSNISVNQPIFKSGGIYYAIKYANSMDNYSKSSIDTQKKELIKNIINLLLDIKKINLTIKKQNLAIKNSMLDITRKKEQVLNGILDTSFLDNAILDSNSKKNNLIDLQYTKQTYINKLATLSDKKYTQLEIPHFALVSKKQYLQNNIYLKTSKDQINNQYWMKNMIISQYLPTVNLTADYTKYHNTDNNPLLTKEARKNIGFNITIPLDIKISNNIQSQKLEYIKQKLNNIDKKNEELAVYKNSQAKLKSLDKKIQIAKTDLKLYDSLLKQIIEQQSVGMKTQSDVDTMINSKMMKQYDIKLLNIDKQIELLNIYSRVNIQDNTNDK
jgi:outer membrane protein TolC